MGSTISHEIGHYLGLNHLTESSGSSHDAIPDTPQCISENISGTNYVTQNSCLSSSSCSTPCTAEANGSYNGITRFCPNTSACQFNHVMWWTTKSFSETTGVGDGNIFSADSSNILLSNPFIN